MKYKCSMADWRLIRSGGVRAHAEVTQESCRRSDVTRKVVEEVEFSSPIGEYGVEGVSRVVPSGSMVVIYEC